MPKSAGEAAEAVLIFDLGTLETQIMSFVNLWKHVMIYLKTIFSGKN